MSSNIQTLQDIVTRPDAAVAFAEDVDQGGQGDPAEIEPTEHVEDLGRPRTGNPAVDEVAESVEEEVLVDDTGDEHFATQAPECVQSIRRSTDRHSQNAKHIEAMKGCARIHVDMILARHTPAHHCGASKNTQGHHD